jgi:hypothetical protein
MSLTEFEVGALFRVVDEATGPLRKILATVRELNDAIKVARDGMAGFSAAASPGIAGAITEVNALTAAWGRVEAATIAAARAAAAPVRSAIPLFRPGVGGGGGSYSGSSMHVRGPGIPLPGGGHASFGGPAMAGVAAVGLSLYEAANMETDVHWLNYHLGRKDSTENDSQSRKLLEDTMKGTGLSLPEVGKAVTDVARIMRDTPGFDVVKEAPRLLRAGLAESLSKGTTLDESVKAVLGLTHMVQAYKPGEMEKLYQVFAYLSTANPASLSSMEKTYSYAVPILRSGADVDPKTAMLLSTVLSTSGVTSSKAGTWLREFGVRAMPGNDKHNDMLKQLGLLDENGKPTWYTGGKPDLVKALEIAGPKAAAMPPEQRLPLEMDLFGRRGGGAFSVLGSPTSIERYNQMRAGMDDQGNINRYNTILGDTMGTSKMVARTTLQEFNVAMIELGRDILPLAIAGVRGLSGVLKIFQGGHQTQEDKTFVPTWSERLHDMMPWSGASALPKPQNQSFTGQGLKAQPMTFLQGPQQSPKPQQISLSLSVDGRKLAQTLSENLSDLMNFPTGAPAANGLAQWEDGHSQMTSS